MILDVVLLLVSFAVILAGAELFTNAIEWVGRKLHLAEGMVGSVLAAVGTALPETMIPIIAIIFVGTEHSDEVGIGAILGAPFMLSTAAMFVTGVAVLWSARGGRRSTKMNIDQTILRRDLRFFLAMYAVAIGMGLPFFEKPFPLRLAVGILLVAAYVFYVYRTSRDVREGGGAEELLAPLRFHRGQPVPSTPRVWIQVAVSLGLIVVGAQLFVREVTVISGALGISALVLSLVIAPLATELPEKFNSVIWVRQKKDTLAMGNISGAMVFQSCIPVAVGLWFTPWVLTTAAIASAVIAILAGLLMQLYLRGDNALSGKELSSLGVLYAAFIVYVVFIYQGPAPALH